MSKIQLALISLIFLLVLQSATAKQVVVVGLFKNKAVVVIDGSQHLLSVDKPAIQGVKLITSNSNRAILEVDGKRNEYRAEGAVGSTDDPADETTVHIYPDNFGMYRTGGTINNSSVNFLVDTGATLIAMSSRHANQLGINYRLDGLKSMAATASGNVQTYIISLDKVTVGGITVTNVKAAVIKGDHPRNVLLGMSFLSRIKFVNKGKALTLIQD